MRNATLRRLCAITANTFTEASRQRFFALLVLLGMVVAVSGAFLRVFNFGSSELKFTADFGFGCVFFFGSILAVVMTTQLFFAELENRTALPLLARPVRRWEFVAGKFLGAWALLGVFTALIFGVLGALLLVRSHELAQEAIRAGESAPWFSVQGLAIFALLQWLRLGVVAALTLLVCSFARSLLYAVTVSSLALLVCQMQGTARAALASGSNSWVRVVVETAGRLLPDLQLFDLGVPLALQPAGVPAGVVASAAGYGIFYTVVLLALAVWLFSDREI
ncbi:MAG: ABC transporter permease [Puniceicoccales bacterium]|jgi:ABC-type transport system involved in multi-copper enzyme maturation permease subunit|nr:ABC transporter permease [Puniceicoccales bacterium]